MSESYSSDSFDADIAAFGAVVDQRTETLFLNIVSAAKASITDGSPLTGAPGQPVQTGTLKNSWQTEFDGPLDATIATGLDYAEPIENGVGPNGPLTLQSVVGGFHSLGLTIAGFDRIVEDETEKLVGAADA